MIKSYRLKIYANTNKLRKLDNLLSFWNTEINKKIDIFWALPSLSDSFAPTEYAQGGRIIRDASNKAWTICKIAKKIKADKPVFKGVEIDINSLAIKFTDFKTKEFDFWVKVTHLEKRNRLMLPCKKTIIFNEALLQGKLKNSAKIIKRKNNFYLQVYVDIPEIKKENISKLGIDVGLNKPVSLSNGRFLGNDLRELRIRTKWRRYKNGLSPYKQGLNRIAKQISKDYTNTDFVVEQLVFKGKKNRSKKFRRNNKNWAYKHLARQLTHLGHLKGFQVIQVDPAYSSQTCPICKSINKANRVNDKFKCVSCGYNNHADTVGAINLLERVAWDSSYPMTK